MPDPLSIKVYIPFHVHLLHWMPLWVVRFFLRHHLADIWVNGERETLTLTRIDGGDWELS